MRTIRVLLADDHVLILEAMRLLLERLGGISVVGSARNGREALRVAKEQRPDIVIMDISMQEMNGIEAAEQIRESLAGTRVLILSSHTSEKYVNRAIRAGVAGYLVKDSLPAELATAVTAIAEGKMYLSPSIAGHVMASAGRDAQAIANDPLACLTVRQREVLQMIAEGKSTKQIASALDVSVKTVETHRAALMERLRIRDIAGLVLFAARNGLVDLGER